MSLPTAESTTDDVLEGVDLTGRVALVTGASAGLGVETTRALTAHGAVVVAGVRDQDKARTALQGAAVDLDRVELRDLDLASLASVRAFADGVVADRDHLDVIIANAGIMACPEGRTADGFETQIGTNHLGHFVLLNRLVGLLDDGGRIVNLSSAAHRFGDIDLHDPSFSATPYDPWVAYGRSKTANALFAVELDRRLAPRGIRAASVHPGMIMTELSRHMTDETLTALLERGVDRMPDLKSIPAGAATSVWAATVAEGDAVGGRYCEDCAVSPVIDDPAVTPGVMAYALDPDSAAELWTWSEGQVGESFDF